MPIMPAFIHKHKQNSQRILVIIFIAAILTAILPALLGEHNEIYGVRISALPDLLLSGFLTFLLIATFTEHSPLVD